MHPNRYRIETCLSVTSFIRLQLHWNVDIVGLSTFILLILASLTFIYRYRSKIVARWRKHEIKNKPARVLQSSPSKTLPDNSDVISSAMLQQSSAIFPPQSQQYFRPWSSVYPPFPVSTPMFPPSDTFAPAVLNRNFSTVSVMVRPRVSASASPPFSPSNSPFTSLMTQYQSSCDSDNGGSRHTTDDYLAAVTLASGFHREN